MCPVHSTQLYSNVSATPIREVCMACTLPYFHTISRVKCALLHSKSQSTYIAHITTKFALQSVTSGFSHSQLKRNQQQR